MKVTSIFDMIDKSSIINYTNTYKLEIKNGAGKTN